MKRILFTTKGHLRPYRSAAIPIRQVKIIALGSNVSVSLTEYNTTNGSKHQHQGDSPSNLRCRFVEFLGQLFHGQGNCEEVERVPRPSEERNEEKEPLLCIQKTKKREGIWGLVHGWFEGRYARRGISADTHMLVVLDVLAGRRVAARFLVSVIGHIDNDTVAFAVDPELWDGG